MSGTSLDDFQEFLAESYAQVLAEADEAGLALTVARVGTGHYVLEGELPGQRGPVTVSAAGRPLPPSPGDVRVWRVVSRFGVSTVPPGPRAGRQLAVAAEATIPR